MAITGVTFDSYVEPKKVEEKRKYDKKEFKYDEYIYLSIVNSDNFSGLIVPKIFEDTIKIIVNHDQNYNIIDSIFDSYEEYRDYEVEISSQARHGSAGSEKLDSKEDILKYFSKFRDSKLNKKLENF